MNNGYIRIDNNIITNNETIIDILSDFENFEIKNIENHFNSKITTNYHNNLWSMSCNSNTCINILEKMFICYNIWKLYKNNIIVRIDPKISKNIINESYYFIKKTKYKTRLCQPLIIVLLFCC